MGSRTAIFNAGKHVEQDSEKLLDLYWNRAELKKAYSETKDEIFRLNKQLKERDGDIARLEQKFTSMEDLLLDPDWVHSVAVHYQLRALCLRCNQRVAVFAEQLKQQREKRQYKALLQTWNYKRSGRASAVKSELDQLRQKVDEGEAERTRVRDEHHAIPWLLRFLKKRSLRQKLESIDQAHVEYQLVEAELLNKIEQLKKSAPPEQPGLDIVAKRSINFMILSFSQQLYIEFADDNLASLVKESGDKSAGAFRYGNRDECQLILDEVASRWNSFDTVADFADVLQKRAKLLSERAMFMQDDDTIPVAGSVGSLILINDGGAVSERNANLLGENYWDITRVLSR